jgi:ABC-type antimicrobial peptide transport system permease subunit
MGIRMALGATPGRAVLAVGLPGLRLTLAGLLLGGVLAVPAARWLESSVWGVSPFDPATLAGVVAVLLAVSALASLLPAARIIRLEPARILREA